MLARHGAYSQLLRIPAGTTNVEAVALPFEGHVDEAFSDPRVAGVTIKLSSWVVPSGLYAYRPADKSFSDLKIGAHGDISSSDYRVSDLSAKAQDGVMVPLSLVQPKGATGARAAVPAIPGLAEAGTDGDRRRATAEGG